MSSGVSERIHQGQPPAPMKSALSLIALVSFAQLASAQPVANAPGARRRSRRPPRVRPPRRSSPRCPDTEKAPLPPGYVEIFNPAFPLPVVAARKEAPGSRCRAARPTGWTTLAPYFAEGQKKEAKDAFDRGFYLKARELLQNEGDSVPVRYLRALSAVRAGDDVRAAEEMASLAEDYPAHGGSLPHARGRGAGGPGPLRGGGEAARAACRRTRSCTWTRGWRWGACCARRRTTTGPWPRWTPLAYRPAPLFGRNVGAEALMAIADIAAEKKDRKREREALWRLWSLYPLSPLAKQAERRLKGLKPPVEAQVARAEQLIELHRNKQGLTVLEPLLPTLKLPEPIACRAHFAYGKGLRKEREHTRAIQSLTPVVEKCQDADLLPRAMYVLGSSRSIVDQKRGPETYERLARDFPGHSFADDALFYAADLYVKTDRPEQALVRLEELEQQLPAGGLPGRGALQGLLDRSHLEGRREAGWPSWSASRSASPTRTRRMTWSARSTGGRGRCRSAATARARWRSSRSSRWSTRPPTTG